MELINNITKTLRDDLSVEIKDGSKLSIAAACFSIYAFQALKEQCLAFNHLKSIILFYRLNVNKKKIIIKFFK